MWFLQCGSWFRLMILSNCRNFIRIPYHLPKVIHELMGVSYTWLVEWSLIVGGLHLVVLHAFGNLGEMVLVLVAQSTWSFQNLLKLIADWVHIVLIHFNILYLTDVSLRVISDIVFDKISPNTSLAATSRKISIWDSQLWVLDFISLLGQVRHVCKTWSLHTLLCDSVEIVLSATYCSVVLRTNIKIYHIIWRVSHWSGSGFYIICNRVLAGVIVNVVLKIWIWHANMWLVFTSTDQNIARIIVGTCVSGLLVVKWNICFIYFKSIGLIFNLVDVILIIVYLLYITIIFLNVLSLESIFEACREFVCKHGSFFCWWTFNQELRCSNHLKIFSCFIDLFWFYILDFEILSDLWNILSCI